MKRFDIMSQNGLEIEEILNTIEDLHQLGKQQSDSADSKRKASDFEFTEEEMQKRGFVESQIQEIMMGINQKLLVKVYAQECYNWKQMHEIRLGLLENIDTTLYENPFFSAEQMHEIRLGLIERLDVSSYARLIFTATDMSNMRKKLLAEAYQVNPNGFGKEVVDEESKIHIRISNDCMEAYIMIPEYKEFSVYEIKKILRRHEIVHGISMKNLKKIVENKISGKEVLIAKGEPAQKGKDGRYEFFFNRLLPESPKVQQNGNIDYTNVVVADKVRSGEALAEYHPSSFGKSGETVTGIVLEGKSGEDLPALTGKGFIRDHEKNIYTATTDGYVSFDEIQYNLNVWNVFIVDGNVNRYNGNITYDGTIHIKGSVSDMAVITASGDIVVDGFIEGARIKAGGNVILKGGVNSGGSGYIQAGGKVMGNFFEFANIESRGKIEGNYFLNCNVKTDHVLIARGSKARIMGGNIKAGKAVESVVIGNYGGTKTVIDVGDMAWIEARMSRYQKGLDKVKSELLQLKDGRDKLRNLLGVDILENNSLFQKTCLAIQVKEEQQAALEREIEYFMAVKRNMASAYVKAAGGLQEGVIILMNGRRRKVEKRAGCITL